MIHPTNIAITKIEPNKDHPEHVVFVAELTCVYKLPVSVELLNGPEGAEKDMIALVEFEARKEMHRMAYGELLKPFADLIAVAKHCPANYQDKLEKATLRLGALLIQPEIQHEETNQDPT